MNNFSPCRSFLDCKFRILNSQQYLLNLYLPIHNSTFKPLLLIHSRTFKPLFNSQWYIFHQPVVSLQQYSCIQLHQTSLIFIYNYYLYACTPITIYNLLETSLLKYTFFQEEVLIYVWLVEKSVSLVNSPYFPLSSIIPSVRLTTLGMSFF